MHVKFEVIALTVLELFAFNAQKFEGSHDPGDAPFSKKMRESMGSYPDYPWKHARQIGSP